MTPTDPIQELDSLEGITYRGLYEMLEEHGEIIITIGATDIQQVKRGLTVHKSRIKTKLEEAGLPTEDKVLRFVELPCTDIGFVRLHIINGQPKMVKIKAIELPDDSV